MSLNPLRNIPSVNDLLEYPRVRKLVDRISPGVVASGVRAVLEEVRSEVQTAASEKTLPSLSELAERIARRVLEVEHAGPVPVINATGVLLGSRLGSPPLAADAIADMAGVAGDFASFQIDLASGEAAQRGRAVEALLNELTGAEAALVAGTPAAATLLACQGLAAGREVIVSRGHLTAVSHDCRVADLIIAGGATVREVGAVNLTRIDDYRQAIGDRSAAIMAVHPSRTAVVGLCESVPLERIVELGRRHQLPVVHNIGLGGLTTVEGIGPSEQPTAVESLRAGADLVLMTGDQLLGGPGCGILLGSRALIRSIAAHPASAALAADKLTLAALAATLRLWREPQKACRAIPLLSLLCTSVENLRNRAERLAPQLEETAVVARAEPIAATTYLTEAPIATHEIPTWRIAIEPAGMSCGRLATALRLGVTPLVPIVEQDRLLVDLRTVVPRQDVALIDAFAALANHPREL